MGDVARARAARPARATLSVLVPAFPEGVMNVQTAPDGEIDDMIRLLWRFGMNTAEIASSMQLSEPLVDRRVTAILEARLRESAAAV